MYKCIFICNSNVHFVLQLINGEFLGEWCEKSGVSMNDLQQCLNEEKCNVEVKMENVSVGMIGEIYEWLREKDKDVDELVECLVRMTKDERYYNAKNAI